MGASALLRRLERSRQEISTLRGAREVRVSVCGRPPLLWITGWRILRNSIVALALTTRLVLPQCLRREQSVTGRRCQLLITVPSVWSCPEASEALKSGRAAVTWRQACPFRQEQKKMAIIGPGTASKLVSLLVDFPLISMLTLHVIIWLRSWANLWRVRRLIQPAIDSLHLASLLSATTLLTCTTPNFGQRGSMSVVVLKLADPESALTARPQERRLVIQQQRSVTVATPVALQGSSCQAGATDEPK